VIPDGSLPPLVLRCRPLFRLLYGGAAFALLGTGTAGLAQETVPGSSFFMETAAPALLILFGAGCAYFTARYAFSRLILDQRGFRLVGPLRNDDVPWASVVRWQRLRIRGGPATLRVVHGEALRRLSIPMIYEECTLLEIGLGQGGFPQF